MTGAAANVAPDILPIPEHGWTCFHCGQHFQPNFGGQRDAAQHFGTTPDREPACLLQRKDRGLLMLVREMEARETELLSHLHQESGDAINALRRRESQHAGEVRRAEEDGYAKAVRFYTPLLQRVDAELGVDGHGAPFENGECGLIDEIRKLLPTS